MAIRSDQVFGEERARTPPTDPTAGLQVVGVPDFIGLDLSLDRSWWRVVVVIDGKEVTRYHYIQLTQAMRVRSYGPLQEDPPDPAPLWDAWGRRLAPTPPAHPTETAPTQARMF